eukprot:TRINITY_DN970_c2_g2_i1.p1 TRINITY_DN970_c2_g2~~TRINITY_DN970_c2_g2_i1.p1  ORF type:complete len:1074 (+),score=154.58 TRINITY_DN970_c2_g2_i1:130-3351(+)
MNEQVAKDVAAEGELLADELPRRRTGLEVRDFASFRRRGSRSRSRRSRFAAPYDEERPVEADVASRIDKSSRDPAAEPPPPKGTEEKAVVAKEESSDTRAVETQSVSAKAKEDTDHTEPLTHAAVVPYKKHSIDGGRVDLATVAMALPSVLNHHESPQVDDHMELPDYDAQMEIGEIQTRTMYKMVAEVQTDAGVKRVLYLSNDQCTMLSGSSKCADKLMEAFEMQKPQLVIQLLLSNGDTQWVDDSRRVWPPCKPLEITHVLSDRNEPSGRLFGFSEVDASHIFLVDDWHGTHGKTYKASANGKEGNIIVWKDAMGCRGSWAPPMETSPSDWKVGDSIRIVRDTAMQPYGICPFNSRTESLEADQSLVTFMQEVIIPLAAQTNAVVLCQAHTPDCMLSRAFSKALELKKHTWSGKPPFTLIGMTSMMRHMYAGDHKKQFWKVLQKKIPSWDAMEARYQRKWPETSPIDRRFDLDKGLSNYVINDSLEKNNDVSALPFLTLQNALIRDWMSMVPGFSLISGFSFANRVLSPLQGGSQVVFVDARERTIPYSLEAAFDEHKEFRAQLTKQHIADFLVNETLSYFHSALHRDELHAKKRTAGHKKRRPLHAQIRELQKHIDNPEGEANIVEREERIKRISKYVVDSCFEDIFNVLPDKEEREAKGQSAARFLIDVRLEKIRENIATLSHPQMHSTNCYALREAKALISSLVTVDRVPDQEPLDGLLLLREAWDQYDIKMYLARRHKKMTKILYATILVLGVLGVIITIIQGDVEAAAEGQKICLSQPPGQSSLGCNMSFLKDFDAGAMGTTVLIISVLGSIIMSIDSFFNSAQRWRKLRTAALTLESMIWMYRTRTGHFAQGNEVSPQIAFRNELSEWSAGIVREGGLSRTSMEQHYQQAVFKHYQYVGGRALLDDVDDFHSPINAQRYIDLRLKPRRKFYEERLPKYVRRGVILQICVFMCSTVSAILSYYDIISAVAMISALSSAITSWMGFTDLSRKCERYTSAIRGIKDLERTWWTLTAVQKSDIRNINKLIIKGEMVLSSEYGTWSAASSSRKGAKDAKRSAPVKSGGKE